MSGLLQRFGIKSKAVPSTKPDRVRLRRTLKRKEVKQIKHKSVAQSVPKPITVCGTCGKDCGTPYNLSVHTAYENGKPKPFVPITCPKCGVVQTNQYNYDAHIAHHDRVEREKLTAIEDAKNFVPFVCDELNPNDGKKCGKAFDRPYKLARHKIWHVNNPWVPGHADISKPKGKQAYVQVDNSVHHEMTEDNVRVYDNEAEPYHAPKDDKKRKGDK